MSPEDRDELEPGGEADEVDPGPPLEELAALTEEPARGFLGRIRRAIERRQLGSQVTELSLTGLVTVFVELLRAVFGMVEETARGGKGGER